MSLKILIVDDSASSRMLMKLALKKEGHQVLEADDGKSGVESLLENQGVKLVVTDINMPVMNGIEFIEKVRNLSDYKFIKIIVLTNPLEEENRKNARKAGASAWMDKPFKPKDLLNIIRKIGIR